MAGIDHQPFKICIINQRLQNFLPYSLVAPPAKPAVYIFPVSVFWWQIPPGRSSPQNPEYAIDELPRIPGITAARPFFAYCVWPDFFPSSIAYIMPMLLSSHFLRPFPL